MPVQNAEIAAMFDQAADLLEIQGENQFRVRAYRRAARTIEGLPQSVRSLIAAQEDLAELPGIGKDLAGKIETIVGSGHFELLDKLKKKLPGELGEIAGLPGLGPKRIKLLYDKVKVRTLNDLRKAIQKGKLHGLHGFGPVIEQKLAAAVEKPVAEKRFRLAVAEAEAEALVKTSDARFSAQPKLWKRTSNTSFIRFRSGTDSGATNSANSIATRPAML
jgi:DNA polymerase (family X)